MSAAKIIDEISKNKPPLRNAFDAVSVIVHLVLKELGFRCADQPQSSANAFLPEGWNSSSDSYSFRYRHPSSAMNFHVKAITLADKLMIFGMSLEEKTPYSLEVCVPDLLLNPRSLSTPMEDAATQFDIDMLQNMITLLKVSIVNKMLPAVESTKKLPSESPFEAPFHPTLQEPPRFSGVGSSDLFPRGGGFPLPGDVGRGDGSVVGPHHPLFGPGVSDPYSTTGANGRVGPRQGGFGAPRTGPFGARFDPYGPPGPEGGAGSGGGEPPPPGFDNMFL